MVIQPIMGILTWVYCPYEWIVCPNPNAPNTKHPINGPKEYVNPLLNKTRHWFLRGQKDTMIEDPTSMTY